MKKSSEILSVEQEIKQSLLSSEAKEKLLAELATTTASNFLKFQQKVQNITSEALANELEEPPEISLDLPEVPTHAIHQNNVAIKLASVQLALDEARNQYNQFCRTTQTKILEVRLVNAPIQMALKKELDTLQITRDKLFKLYQGQREEKLTSLQQGYLFNRVENFKADARGFGLKVTKQVESYWKRMDRNLQLDRAVLEMIQPSKKPSSSEAPLAAARNLITRFKIAVQGNRVNQSPVLKETEQPSNNGPKRQ